MIEGQEKARYSQNKLSDRFTEWVMLNRQKAAALLAGILLLLIGGLWAIQARNNAKVKDFELADTLADDLQRGPRLFSDKAESEVQDQALLSLKALDDKYTILQPRFDSLIAEEYIVRGQKNEIDPYATRTIERLRSIGLNDFADFSEVSRKTALGEYAAALTLANELKGKLQATNEHYTLQGFLLLHIATLNQKLANHEGMISALLALKEHLGLTKREVPLTQKQKELASEMIAMLQDRQSSLLTFMEQGL